MDHAPVADPRSTLPPEATAALEAALARAQREHRLPSAVAGVVRSGRLLWSGTAGTLDGRADGPVPTADTQYRIGSITKTFTAVMIMVLRDRGRLSVADRVDDHLPDTPYGDVRLDELLSHVGGLPAETAGPWWERVTGETWEHLITAVGAPVHAARARHHYSNLGFAVLGRIVAEHTGASWADAVRTTLLEPLGMRRTTARPVGAAAPGWAVHPWTDQLHAEPEHDAGAMAPAGQLWSTVDDLARWAALLGGDTGDVLAGDTLTEMLALRSVDDDHGQPWTSGKGLGWQIWNHDGHRTAGHFGSMPGFQAGLVVDPATGDGAISLTNSTAGPAPSPRELLTELTARVPLAPPPWHRAAPPAGAEALLGTWFWGPRPSVMRVVDGVLTLGEPGTARGTRFRPGPDADWVAIDGYFAGETLRAPLGPDGRARWLDLASFRFTRLPYDPDGDVPGGLDDTRWSG